MNKENCSTKLVDEIILYRPIILPVVLYGVETLSLTLRKEHRLRVFEKGAEEDNGTYDGGD